MKKTSEKVHEFTSVNRIQKSIFEKLASKEILTLKKLVSMGFSFNVEVGSYNTFANTEDVDREIINTYVSQGVLTLDLLRSLGFSLTLEEIKKTGLDPRETKIMIAMGFVVLGDSLELDFADNPEVIELEERLATRQALQDLSKEFPLLVAKGPTEEQ